MRLFFETMDETRRARDWTWAQLGVAINAPFAGTPSIPISTSTLRGMLDKHSVTSAVVVQVLRCLKRSPESFMTGPSAIPGRPFRDPGIGRILRFDTRALYDALNVRREERHLTWSQVAAELPHFTASMLTNLASGPLIGCPRVFRITQWLHRPAADFVKAYGR